MNFLLFVGFGNTLAEAEIETRIGNSREIFPDIYSLESDDEALLVASVSQLGSSIKLARKLEGLSQNPQSLAEKVTHKNFSLTTLPIKQNLSELSHDIKSFLEHSRFVLATDNFGLSPIILTKHKVDEFFLGPDDSVWQTTWVHDFRHWIQKDRHMPFNNPKAGMLPPKIARSLVNLVPATHFGSGKLLVDPFCGSGRILVEAAELDFEIAGSDAVATQSTQTKANLDSIGFKADIVTLDATHLSTKFQSNVDTIVTEPFMGKPNPRPDKIKYLVPGLEKLYLGCLKDWSKALKPKGIVVMIFPVFNDGKKDYKTSTIVDEKLLLSYNLLKRDIYYSRPGAVVRREIVVLEKK